MINEIEKYTTKTVLEYTKLYSTLNLLPEGSSIVKVGNYSDIGLDAILRGVSSKKGFKYQSLSTQVNLQSGSGGGDNKPLGLGDVLTPRPERPQTDLLQSEGVFPNFTTVNGNSTLDKETLPIDLLYLDMKESDFISQGFRYMERVRPAGFAVIDNLEDVRMALACYINKQNHGAINPIWKVVEDGRMGNSVILRRL